MSLQILRPGLPKRHAQPQSPVTESRLHPLCVLKFLPRPLDEFANNPYHELIAR
jgi:hypothetical protein